MQCEIDYNGFIEMNYVMYIICLKVQIFSFNSLSSSDLYMVITTIEN